MLVMRPLGIVDAFAQLFEPGERPRIGHRNDKDSRWNKKFKCAIQEQSRIG